MEDIINLQRKIINLQIFFSIILAFIIIGAVMNFLVITNNGGRMPVLDSFKYVSETHFSYQDNSEIEFPQFSDKLALGRIIFSIGDLIMFLGLFFLIVFSILLIYYHWRLKKLYREWGI